MVIAIITAGGSGKRVGGPAKKQFHQIAGKPLINHTLELFINNSRIDCIIIVLPEDEIGKYHFDPENDKRLIITAGGMKRAESVFNGIIAAGKFFDEAKAPDSNRIVLIHDGVRPFAGQRLINEVIDKAIGFGAAVPVLPLADTLIKIDAAKVIEEYPNREQYMSVQTPQGYMFSTIVKAYEKAGLTAMDASDESSLVHAAGFPIQLIEGDKINFKITTPEDLKIAEFLFLSGNA
jgi:2-C-methyl-D-erythritol 4-phosphate cytidylyltransferase